MNDKNSFSRLGVTLADVVGEFVVERFRSDRIRADRQESRRLLHDEDVSIFVKDHDPTELVSFG
jgi:hypothetical protein